MTAEIERFVADAKRDAALRVAIDRQDGDIDALVRLAASRGYAIRRADVDAYLAARTLRDDQLDDVAAGRGGPRDPAGDRHHRPTRWDL